MNVGSQSTLPECYLLIKPAAICCYFLSDLQSQLVSHKASLPLACTTLYCLVTEAHVYEQIAQKCYMIVGVRRPRALGRESDVLTSTFILLSKARFPFKPNRLRCVHCVNENRNKRLRWQAHATNASASQ